MAEYSEDYVEFDKLGIKEVRCMKCNTPVAVRDHTGIGDENVLAMRKLSNWRQVRIELNNGSYAEPIFCVQCASNIDEKKTISQIKKGWQIELKAKGFNDDEIKEKLKHYDKLDIKEKKEK